MFKLLKKPLFFLIFTFFFITLTPLAYSQEEGGGDTPAQIAQAETQNEQIAAQIPEVEDKKQPNAITMMAMITIMSLLPFSIMLLTSFVKIVIVLALLRNALGIQQSPPNQALNGIALLMTIYVMFPTCLAMYQEASDYIHEEAPTELFSPNAAQYIVNIVDKTKEPLRAFLIRNMSSAHQRNFYQLAYQRAPALYKKTLKVNDFIVIVPAYITSQIKGAFEIGVLIYLPFFVIDLVTSNILLAMGMMMLSPLTISLPLKLLLIVMTDGWTLIIHGLVQTYKM